MNDIQDEGQVAPVKRKKVRKGTQSCWECKRRKVRCIFTSSEHITCIGCERRGKLCLSQELPEDWSPAKSSNRHLGERIAKVEDLMKDFLASKGAPATSHSGGKSHENMHSAFRTRPIEPTPISLRAPLTSAEVRYNP